MTNVWGDSGKKSLRHRLFQVAVEALEEAGWKVERIRRSGKSSIRQITKGKMVKTVTIRTSQDAWIAFPRNERKDGWATLEGADYVVASTVDSSKNPRFINVHLFEGGDIRERFDRTYAARQKAGYTLPPDRGVWISLYDEDSNDPVTLVGAGAGLAYPPIKTIPLTGNNPAPATQMDSRDTEKNETLTIGEAKRRLALSLGVAESNIAITISG